MTVSSGTPTPTPSAPPASGTTYPAGCVGADATTTDSFSTAYTSFHYNGSGGGPDFLAPQVSDGLRYSQSEKRYTFFAQNNLLNSSLDESTSFGPADVVASQSNQQQTVYSRTCGSYFYQLMLFNPGPANPVLALNYASYGNYWYRLTSATGVSHDFRPFGYGLATSAAGLNRTGISTYTGRVEGRAQQPLLADYTVTGTLVLTVDFDRKTFTAVVDLTSQRVGGGAAIHLGPVNITQSGSANLAQLIGTTGGGSLAGFLAGPAAEEVAVTLNLTTLNPDIGGGNNLNLALSGAAKR
ncbi:MAG: hypothetical protein ABI810_17955 [Sphingomonas bacterium]